MQTPTSNNEIGHTRAQPPLDKRQSRFPRSSPFTSRLAKAEGLIDNNESQLSQSVNMGYVIWRHDSMQDEVRPKYNSLISWMAMQEQESLRDVCLLPYSGESLVLIVGDAEELAWPSYLPQTESLRPQGDGFSKICPVCLQ